jgi:hypothetical protein
MLTKVVLYLLLAGGLMAISACSERKDEVKYIEPKRDRIPEIPKK